MAPRSSRPTCGRSASRSRFKKLPFSLLFEREATPGARWDIGWFGWIPDYADPSQFIGPLIPGFALDFPGAAARHYRHRIAATAKLTGQQRLRAYGRARHRPHHPPGTDHLVRRRHSARLLLPPASAARPSNRSTASTSPPSADAICPPEPTEAKAAPPANRRFARHLVLVRRVSYRTIGLDELVWFVVREPVSLPSRPLLLTFDGRRLQTWTGSDANSACAGLQHSHPRRHQARAGNDHVGGGLRWAPAHPPLRRAASPEPAGSRRDDVGHRSPTLDAAPTTPAPDAWRGSADPRRRASRRLLGPTARACDVPRPSVTRPRRLSNGEAGASADAPHAPAVDERRVRRSGLPGRLLGPGEAGPLDAGTRDGRGSSRAGVSQRSHPSDTGSVGIR